MKVNLKTPSKRTLTICVCWYLVAQCSGVQPSRHRLLMRERRMRRVLTVSMLPLPAARCKGSSPCSAGWFTSPPKAPKMNSIYEKEGLSVEGQPPACLQMYGLHRCEQVLRGGGGIVKAGQPLPRHL